MISSCTVLLCPLRDDGVPAAAAAMKAMAEELASEILDQFREEWGKMAEAMGEAEEAFDDISELFEGRTGFDLSLR